MAIPQLQAGIDSASKILAEWNSFVETLSSYEGPQREAFDLEKTIPSLSPPATIKEIETKLTGAVSLTHNLSSIASIELIPDSTVNEITARVSAVFGILEKLTNQIKAFEIDNPIASLDAAAMTASNEKGQQINLAPIFIELYPAIQSLLLALYQIRTMAGINEKRGFSIEFSYIDAARSAQRRAYGELNRLRHAVAESRKQLDKIVSEAASKNREIESMKVEATTALQRAEEQKQQAEALISRVTEINTNAETLKTAVGEYQATFDDFSTQLDSRNKQLTMGQNEQGRLFAEMTSLLDDAARLRDRSREVLGEATMSGLSESFAREMKAAGRQLLWMQFLFFLSIALLFVAAGIVLNAFPWLEQHSWIKPTRIDPPAGADAMTLGVFHLVNFLGKAIILVPPLLLLAFAARRYAEVFRLKTLYTYKYTIAASLPGFKIEAPNFSDAITASAFQNLLANPVENHDQTKPVTPVDEGSSFLQKLVEPVVKKALDKLSDPPKKA
ncbi:MAG: hypothetical protein OJF48_003779 [Afipia sp.]|nr:MAG: hypothetical protein OJF48_003779 [Afipia sp.]